MLDATQVKSEGDRLRQSVRELTDVQRAKFYQLFKQQMKDPDNYAVLNYLLITGLHHFYLRKWLRGFINLGLFFIALILMLFGLIWPGIILIATVALTECYALFRSQLIVQDYNNQLMNELLQQVSKEAE